MIAIKSYVFQKDLMDDPVVVVTTKAGEKWATYVENLPVKTFRDGAFQRQVLSAADTKAEALKYHRGVIDGKK